MATPSTNPRPGHSVDRVGDRQRVTARSWCRVDLAGGTLDIWPLGLLHPGACTVNVAVDLPATAEVVSGRPGPDGDTLFRVDQAGESVSARDAGELMSHSETALVGRVVEALGLPPSEIRLETGSPRGGGLGASSALVVALIAAGEELLGRPRSAPARQAALGRDLEARLMELPTGVQDHYPGVLGGALEIGYRPGGELVERLPVDLEALGRSMVVAYTGQSHFSAGQNWEVVRRRLDGEAESVELFAGIAGAAHRVADALRAGDLEAVGEGVAAEWSFRRHLADGVSTPKIEDLLARAADVGAWGGKACGAGGGGSIVVLCPAARRTAVVAALEAGGAEALPARPTDAGLAIDRQPL